MKRNILVLRRCSLVRVRKRPSDEALTLLTSSCPSRRTGRRTSYSPERPSTDISVFHHTAHGVHRTPRPALHTSRFHICHIAFKGMPLTNSLGGA